MADRRLVPVGLLLVGLVSCSGRHPQQLASVPTPPASSGGGSVTNQDVGMPAAAVDVRRLPLGSGRWSAAPAVGRLQRCVLPQGGPPVRIPPWVDTIRSTWDITSKPAVAGNVRWDAKVAVSRQGDYLVVKGDGLPRHSGMFPVAASDPSYAFNPDPSPVFAHDVDVRLPYNPSLGAAATCERGVVGVAIDGVPILDGFDAGGNDADAVEVQDSCHGHPNDRVGYHYHGLSPCLLDANSRVRTALVGWALDGFGIYVEYDAKRRLLTDSALDGCHGRTSLVPWHGREQRIYHYDMTIEFPYSVGCFRGRPVSGVDAVGLGVPPGP